MTIVEFLEARIAEDEATARDAGADAMTGARWKSYPREAYEELQARTLAHSRRGLRECEAKRRIVEDFEYLHADYQRHHTDSLWARRFQATMAMAHLAAVYADHPDYDEGWRA